MSLTMKYNYVAINVQRDLDNISLIFGYIRTRHSVKIKLSQNYKTLEVEVPFISLKQLYDQLTKMIEDVEGNYLYRVPNKDFRVPRERVRHNKKNSHSP